MLPPRDFRGIEMHTHLHPGRLFPALRPWFAADYRRTFHDSAARLLNP
jgi:hypothetical protein